MIDIGADLQKAFDEGYKKGKAESVQHGHWIITDSKTHVEPIFNCSICGNFEAWGYTECYKYCPNCGARMDEVEE